MLYQALSTYYCRLISLTKVKRILRFAIIFIIIFSSLYSISYALSPQMEEKHKEGITYIDNGEYKKALDCFKQILSKEPNASKVYNDLGLVYIKLGRSDEAIKAWLKALSLDPKFIMSRYNLIRAYIDKREYDRAISNLKVIIRQDPRQERAYNTLGVIYWTLGSHDLAEEQFKKAIAVKPDYKVAYLNLARFYIESAVLQYKKLYILSPNNKATREEYRRALQVDKYSSTSHFLLGRLFQEEGNLDSAISEYGIAASLDKRYQAPFFIKEAQRLRAGGQMEKAAQDYEIALALDPKIKGGYYELGEIYYLLGQSEKAIPLLKKAVTLTPENAYGHHYLALSYYKLGNYNSALTEFKKALALGNDYQFHYGLASTYEAMGQYELAKAEYSKVIALYPKKAKEIKLHIASLKSRPFLNVTSFIKRWSKAWENRDLKTYAACYSPDFHANGKNLKKWLEWKKRLFSIRSGIKIGIDNLKFNQKNDLLVACFRQSYKDNSHQDEGQKCLWLKNKDGWHIIEERWQPLNLAGTQK